MRQCDIEGVLLELLQSYSVVSCMDADNAQFTGSTVDAWLGRCCIRVSDDLSEQSSKLYASYSADVIAGNPLLSVDRVPSCKWLINQLRNRGFSLRRCSAFRSVTGLMLRPNDSG